MVSLTCIYLVYGINYYKIIPCPLLCQNKRLSTLQCLHIFGCVHGSTNQPFRTFIKKKRNNGRRMYVLIAGKETISDSE
jgi:hypothetical protein